MISILLAAALSQTPPAPPALPTPPVAPPALSAPAAPAPPAIAPPSPPSPPAVPELTEEQKKAQLAAERQERVGCVVKTGTRIKRKDRDNCATGSSISKEDIDRAGGVFVTPGNAPVPAGAGG
ncbi:MAG: hypothetical protein ACO24Z_07485 [Arenimonas sp.]